MYMEESHTIDWDERDMTIKAVLRIGKKLRNISIQHLGC
jgi:hypothetical protein